MIRRGLDERRQVHTAISEVCSPYGLTAREPRAPGQCAGAVTRPLKVTCHD